MCFDTRHSVSPLASMDKDFFGRFSIENVTIDCYIYNSYGELRPHYAYILQSIL